MPPKGRDEPKPPLAIEGSVAEPQCESDDGANLSFRTESEVVGANSKLVPYSDFYEGKVIEGQIAFKKWDDIEGGGQVEEFVANRAH